MLLLGILGHASAASGLASSASSLASSASSLASSASSVMPSGLDVIEKALDVYKETQNSNQDQIPPPKTFKEVLMEQGKTAGKGMAVVQDLASGNMTKALGDALGTESVKVEAPKPDLSAAKHKADAKKTLSVEDAEQAQSGLSRAGHNSRMVSDISQALNEKANKSASFKPTLNRG